MKLVVMAMAVCVGISGCTSYEWKKSGSSTIDFERDKSFCVAKSYTAFPPNIIIEDKYDFVANMNRNQANIGNYNSTTSCMPLGYGVSCNTLGTISVPSYQPPIMKKEKIDINQEARAVHAGNCLRQLGWNKYKK